MIQLIKTATLSGNDEQRREAQNTLIEQRKQQPERFFLEAGAVLQSNEVDTNTRQAAGALLARSVVSESGAGCFWDQLSPPGKATFKETVLSTLISPDRKAARAAATVVASICSIEIPRNEWTQILATISHSATLQDPQIKEISILMLGFIGEKLRTRPGFQLPNVFQQTIMSAIFLGFQGVNVNSTLKALSDCLPCTYKVLANPQGMQFLMKQIVNTFRTDPIPTLQLLSELARWNYVEIGPYVPGLINVLQPLINNPTQDDQSCLLAVQFLQSLTSAYQTDQEGVKTANKMNYMQGQLGSKVVQILLNTLCVVQKDDDEGMGVSAAAYKCLQNIFEVDASYHEKTVLSFVEHTISHANWKYRQASIRAFTALLPGLMEQRILELVNMSLLQLIGLINDPQPQAQIWAMRSFVLIADQCPSSIIHHASALDILKLLLSRIHSSQAHTQQTARLISYLCEYCKQKQNNFFQHIGSDIIKLLFQCAFQDQSSLSTVNTCMIAVMRLLSAITNKDLILKHLLFFVSLFPQLNAMSGQRRRESISSIFTIYHTCLLNLKNTVLDSNLLKQIYDIIIEYYNRQNDVTADGLYAAIGLSFFFPNRSLFDNFWKYLQHALNKTKEEETLRAALSCACNFAILLGDQISDHLPLLLAHFTRIFANGQFTFHVKMQILQCFGDLFLYCKKSAPPHLKSVMELVLTSCQEALRLHAQDTTAEELFHTLVNTLTGIVYGINHQGVCKEFLQYVPSIFEFVRMTTEKTRKPKVEYVKKSTLLLADIAKEYKQETKQLVAQVYVKELVITMNKYNQNNCMGQEIQYIRTCFK